MAENSSTSPATGGNTTITGTTGVDSLSGGGGSDTIIGGSGADRLSGDAPLQGQWQYSVYDRDFTSANNQTQFITSGTLIGTGYVDDFGVRALRNTLGGTAAGNDRNDYGVVYRSNFGISTTGTYTFSTTSDDGSRIIIRDSSGNVVFNLDNDFHQPPTTRSASVTLTGGQTYTIEVYFWENLGGDSLSGTIAGPGFAAIDLATAPQILVPPTAPGHVDGNDSILGEAGNDTITGGGGNDQLYGGADDDSILGEAGLDTIYGGDGSDRLFGGTEDDLIYGGAASDTIDGGTGADILYGDDGDDSVLGDIGNDTLFGGIGNDQLYGGADSDSILGDAGLDTIYGGDGTDSLSGGTENDLIYG
ncbi:MAG: calcium-binding protein, partial [Tabrizicola sp.]